MAWHLTLRQPLPPAYGTPLWFWALHVPLRAEIEAVQTDRYASYKFGEWNRPRAPDLPLRKPRIRSRPSRR
jgi:hypothetical protein